MDIIVLTDKQIDDSWVCTKVTRKPTPNCGLWVTTPQMAHSFDADFYMSPFIDDGLFNLTKPYIPCCGTSTEVYNCINNGCETIWLDDYTKLERMQSIFNCLFFVTCPIDKVTYLTRRKAGIFIYDDNNMDNMIKAVHSVNFMPSLKNGAVFKPVTVGGNS